MTYETKSDKNFNTSGASLWEKKSGHLMSMTIDAKSYDALKKFFDEIEIGGKLIIKKLSNESREKFQNPDKAPHAFLEYISKESVQNFESKQTTGKTSAKDYVI